MKKKRRDKGDKKLNPVGLSTRTLFVTVCLALTFETLFFRSDLPNAYMAPKVVAVLLGAAVLLPQLSLLWFRDKSFSLAYSFVGVFVLLLIAVALATVNSMNPFVSFWGGDWRRMGWITHFAMITAAIAVGVSCAKDFHRLKVLLSVVVAGGIASGAYGLLQWVGWDPFLPQFTRDKLMAQFGGQYRAPGTIGQSTYFANFLLYPFFASIALLIAERGWYRLFGVTGLVTTASALVFATAARGSILGCAAGILVFAGWLTAWWLRSKWQPHGSRSWVLVIAVLCGLIVAYALSSAILQSGRFATFGTDTASIGRILLWSDVVGQVLPNFWMTGTGPGMFRAAYARYRTPSYGIVGPDVHWESAHNVFLDRFSEQGVLGLLAFVALIAAFVANIHYAVRSASSDWKKAGVYVAIAAGMTAALISNCFNGEIIPTAYYFYIWVAISFAAAGRCLSDRRWLESVAVRSATVALVVVLSIGLAWYAASNWSAEVALRDADRAANTGSVGMLIDKAESGEQSMSFVGIYHLEFADRFIGLLQLNDPGSDRLPLAQKAIRSSLWAVERSDKPMLALLNLVWLGDRTGDARLEEWQQRLKEIDPHWFRPHEMSARLHLSKGQMELALKEATIAYQLAPYVESSSVLWRQLNALRRETNLR